MIRRYPTLILTLLLCLAPAPAIGLEEPGVTNPALETTITEYRSQGAESTLPKFESLYENFVAEGDWKHAALALRYIGECHWRLGNFEPARTHLEQALVLSRDLDLRLAEGKTLNVLGLLEWDLGNYDAAISLFTAASEIGKEIGDRRLAGSTLNNLSLVYDELGDYSTSLAQYHQALELYEGANFPRGESDTLGNIGGVYLLLGRYQEALGYYRRALLISEKLESKTSMSLDHGNLALCYLGLGQLDNATQHVQTALGLAVSAGMRKEQALWLRSQGNIFIRSGKYDLGLASHRQALAIYEEIGARGSILDSLIDMGRIHFMLGDSYTAERYFERGTELAVELGAAQAVTANLLTLGDLQFSRDHYPEAESLFQQALKRATDAGELNLQAESLLRLSLVHRESGHSGVAANEARKALSIADTTGAAAIGAHAWYALGETARLEGKVASALEAYSRSLASAAGDNDPELLWQVHYGSARSHLLADRKQAAVDELKSAIQVIESVRARLREKRFKAGYVQDKYQVYIDLVRLQLELGQTHQALSSAERLRARSFLNQLETGNQAIGNQPSGQAVFALRERIRQLQSVLEKENELPVPERRQRAMDSFSRELIEAEREYQALLDDIGRPGPIGTLISLPSMTEVQASLRPGEALLEYVVDRGQVMVFVMRPGELRAVSSELDKASLVAKVNLVRDLIQDPSNNSWRRPAASLAESLFNPLLQEQLLTGVRHLYLVPHEILNYLPFALLPLQTGEGIEQAVVDQYTLTYLPAAATLASTGSNKRAREQLLAVAPEKSGLRFSREEARSISDMYWPHSRLLAGAFATESAFKQAAGHYGILHLSTHGYFNSRNPLLSGLELEADESNDGLLEVHEILGLSLGADLVTLSACETGLGSGYFNRIPAGDDFVSLTRAFLFAGSRSVLATLWQVDDRSTVEFMEEFYNRLGPHAGIGGSAAALAQVQRKLKSSKTYYHPFYWAPFILVGQHSPAEGAGLLARRG